MVNRTVLFVLGMTALLAVGACGKKEPEKPKGRVFFSEPQDGAEVKSPVKVVMGVEGIEIKPAGEVVEGTGHHHLLINQDSMAAGQVIPTDDNHKHFGKGQTETELELAPGDYKLTLQFADGLHRSFGKDMSATIQIKVAAN